MKLFGSYYFTHSTKSRLHERGHPGVLEPSCPLHLAGPPETIEHVVFCNSVRPVWSWLFCMLTRLTKKAPVLPDGALFAESDGELMFRLLTEWLSRAPEAMQTMWRGMMVTMVDVIVRRRNKLSIDKVKVTTATDHRRNRREIIEKFTRNWQTIVYSEAQKVIKSVDRIENNNDVQKYYKNLSDLNETYLARSVWGHLVPGNQLPTRMDYLLKQPKSYTILYPREFKHIHEFKLSRSSWAGRTRSSNHNPD